MSVVGRGFWPVGLLVSGLSIATGSTVPDKDDLLMGVLSSTKASTVPDVNGQLVGGVSRTTGSTVLGEAAPDA